MMDKKHPKPATKQRNRYDVAIVGGGPAGLTLAATLAQLGLSIALIERAPFPSQLLPAFDGRTTAIAYQGYKLLEDTGLWREMEKLASPINTIRVADQNTRHVLDFDSAELGKGPFGHIVENRHLRHTLLAALRRAKNVTFMNPASVTALDTTGTYATLTLDNGSKIEATLVAAADGRASPIRQMLGIKTFDLTYNQHAIVCTLQATEPHNDLALEHFLPEGPFATLPMQNNQVSIVWTVKPETADAVMALDDEDFLQALKNAGGAYLGDISLVTGRFRYPLSLKHAARYTAPHVVLMGEAAHAIHPIAGQGFNLGLRDIECLRDLISQAMARGLRVDDASVLHGYEKLRRRDNQRMAAATDVLDRLFSNDIWPVARARQWGLSVVAAIPPLRRFFMRQAMGAAHREQMGAASREASKGKAA